MYVCVCVVSYISQDDSTDKDIWEQGNKEIISK
jgi:hypothetical protein